jgi:hypothetical protein
MYTKDVTAFIVYCWGHGLTGEETVKALLDKRGLKVSLNTVYRKRQSMTASEMIDELQREQLRDIASTEDEELKLKYRNEFLKILLPVRIEQKSLSVSKVEINDKSLTAERLAKYEQLVKYGEAASKIGGSSNSTALGELQGHNPEEPMDHSMAD